MHLEAEGELVKHFLRFSRVLEQSRVSGCFVVVVVFVFVFVFNIFFPTRPISGEICKLLPRATSLKLWAPPFLMFRAGDLGALG